MEKLELKNALEKIIKDGNGRNHIAEVISQLEQQCYPEIIEHIQATLDDAILHSGITANGNINLPDEHGRIMLGKTSTDNKDAKIYELVEKALGITENTLEDFKRYHHITTGGFEIETGYELDENFNHVKMINVYLHIDNAKKLLATLKTGIPNYDALAALANATRTLMSRFGTEFLSLDIKEKRRFEKGEISHTQRSAFAMAIVTTPDITYDAIKSYNNANASLLFSHDELESWISLRDELTAHKHAWESHRLATRTTSKFVEELAKRIEGYINVAGKEQIEKMISELS